MSSSGARYALQVLPECGEARWWAQVLRGEREGGRRRAQVLRGERGEGGGLRYCEESRGEPGDTLEESEAGLSVSY